MKPEFNLSEKEDMRKFRGVMIVYTILIVVSPVCIDWNPNFGNETSTKEYRMSNSMTAFNFVLGVTSIWFWMISMVVFGYLIYYTRTYMKSYYNEFFPKIFWQSFSTGIYIFVIIISSWTTVYFLLKFSSN